MNCPKCGYEQEERLDCKKCGIVFSKYTALHHLDKPQNPEDISHSQAREAPEEDSDYGLMELRQALRELSHRFSEMEFERAQRHQLRTEIRNLEQQFHEQLVNFASRIDEAEKLRNEREALQDRRILPSAEFDQLLQRVEALEALPENCARDLEELKTEVAELKAGPSGEDPGISDVIAAMDLKCQERLLPLAKLTQDMIRVDILGRSLEKDMRIMQEVAAAIPGQQAEMKSDLLELFERVRQLDTKLDSILIEFRSHLGETEEDRKSAIEQNVQSILESLDHLRCSVASLAPKL